MAMRTIQCTLSAPPETRKRLWNWTEKYTLLINQLLENVAEDSRFPEWFLKGEVSQTTIKTQFLDPLKIQATYTGLPGRFYDSAKYFTHLVYQSWFAIQAHTNRRLEGKKRWLNIVSTDAVSDASDESCTQVCQRASQLLEKAEAKIQDLKQQASQSSQAISLIQVLMDEAETVTDKLDRRALIHLLLNNLEVNDQPVAPQDLRHRLTKKQIEIERLEAKLQSQLPKCRDPIGLKYLESLAAATSLPSLPKDPKQLEEELKHWQKQTQISKFNPLHYPITFQSADSLYWSTVLATSGKSSRKHRHVQGIRVGVSFKGFKKDIFKILCDRRQLYIFQRLREEWEIYSQAIKENKRNPEIIPPALGLFPLRTAQLLWRPDPKHAKATEPWNRHRLYLNCTIDTQLLTAEGTESVRLTKLAKCQSRLQKKNKELSSVKPPSIPAGESSDPHESNKHQLHYCLRTISSIQRLERSPLERPKQETYIGNPDLILGVSLSRNPPLMAAVVNTQTHKVIKYCSAQQLLDQRPSPTLQQTIRSKKATSQRHLVKRQQILKQRDVEDRNRGSSRNRDDSSQRLQRLGIYLDRVLAKRLVEWAMFRQVGRIVLPQLEGIRDVVESDVRARARLKYPHYVKLQREYAKSYRASFHHWSYARLTDCIQGCAVNHGIPTEVRFLMVPGNLRERAVQIAMILD